MVLVARNPSVVNAVTSKDVKAKGASKDNDEKLGDAEWLYVRFLVHAECSC
jgi:hypothetical protein